MTIEQVLVPMSMAASLTGGAKGDVWLQLLADALEAGLPADGPAVADACEEVVRQVAEREGLKAGDLIHPARVALTGQGRSAGIFDVMEMLGRERVIARLRKAA